MLRILLLLFLLCPGPFALATSEGRKCSRAHISPPVFDGPGIPHDWQSPTNSLPPYQPMHRHESLLEESLKDGKWFTDRPGVSKAQATQTIVEILEVLKFPAEGRMNIDQRRRKLAQLGRSVGFRQMVVPIDARHFLESRLNIGGYCKKYYPQSPFCLAENAVVVAAFDATHLSPENTRSMRTLEWTILAEEYGHLAQLLRAGVQRFPFISDFMSMRSNREALQKYIDRLPVSQAKDVSVYELDIYAFLLESSGTNNIPESLIFNHPHREFIDAHLRVKSQFDHLRSRSYDPPRTWIEPATLTE